MKNVDDFLKTISQEGEEWKKVKGFESRYLISNFGQLVSVGGSKSKYYRMNPHISPRGYRLSTLRQKDKNTRVCETRYGQIHALVAEAFLVKPHGDDICVNHMDGNKLNNHISNLEFCTNSENLKHAHRIGLIDVRGEKCYCAILTRENVLYCRKNYVKSSQIWGCCALGRKFGVSEGTIRCAMNGRSWKWLE